MGNIDNKMSLKLTENFYTWMRTVLLGSNTTITASTTGTSGWASGGEYLGYMKNILGNKQTSFPGSSTYLGKNATLNYWQSGTWWGTYFCIGNDNTSATENDYKLSGDYVFGTDYTIDHKVATDYPIVVNGKAVLLFNVTFNAKTDITIGEIGMIKQIQATSTMSDSYLFLFGRATIGETEEDKIKLTEGQSATFQISIEI